VNGCSGADSGMDTNTPPSSPAPDLGPDDSALARLLRAAAAPLRARPDVELRRRHIAVASATARGELAPARSGRARSASRARSSLRGVLRPVLAGGLALSLIAAGVTAVAVGLPGGLLTRGGDTFELAMAPGFTPSPVPVERAEDHVILTVDADRAELLSDELTQLLDGAPTVLSVRNDRTAFTVPASVAARLELADVETVADTPLSTFATPVTQSPVPSWGLDRIDATDEPLDGRYQFRNTGAGVRVYVIDTGVRSDHSDLSGRVIPGWSAIDDGRGTEDCNGHGTHVAGTVAGSAFGVAKGATIVAIRVLDCNGAGFASSVVSGISWAIANHPGGPGVINLSLGGPANSAIDRAVADATARGLVVVAAAGNEGGDACAVSPARAASAVTTGATTSRDARASYSNFGGCVDMFAPGSGITSAWHTGSGASATLSGTSMAAPHVAGIAARLLQADPGAGPSRIADLLTGSATSGAVDGTNGSPNLLANLVDFEEIECAALIDEALEAGDEIPEECLEEYCEMLEQEGTELPEECLEDDEDGTEEDDERDEEEREGDGRPDSLPGLDGQLPPGFGGAVPGLERAPGLEGRVPPGLTDGGPPGLVRDVPRVNGLSIVRDGTALLAGWRAPEGAASYVLECTAQRPPSWSTDLTLTIAAGSVLRDGDRVSVTLPARVDGFARCRVAAELEGVLGVRSNAANVPAAPVDEPEEAPAEGEGSGANIPGQPAAPGQGNSPAVPGQGNPPAVPGQGNPPAVPGPPNQGGSSADQSTGGSDLVRELPRGLLNRGIPRDVTPGGPRRAGQ
jgi:subtilisin family serine protease